MGVLSGNSVVVQTETPCPDPLFFNRRDGRAEYSDPANSVDPTIASVAV
jgi:hypothetical protein